MVAGIGRGDVFEGELLAVIISEPFGEMANVGQVKETLVCGSKGNGQRGGEKPHHKSSSIGRLDGANQK